MEATHVVPDKPPIYLPKQPDELEVGTKSAGLIVLDNTLLAKENRIRIEAMKDRDRLESNEFGDQLIKMQESSSWMMGLKLTCNLNIKMTKELKCSSGSGESLNQLFLINH